tara:strand:- start:73 stop:207 length:135 start_codon:yes stop_codon:yes gene_type:complete
MNWYKHIDNDSKYQSECCNLLDEDLLEAEKQKQEEWHHSQTDRD